MDMSAFATAAKPFVASAIRHAATAVAGWEVAHGMVNQSDDAAATQIAAGVITYAVVQLWSFIQKNAQKQAVNDAHVAGYGEGYSKSYASNVANPANPAPVQQGG